MLQLKETSLYIWYISFVHSYFFPLLKKKTLQKQKICTLLQTNKALANTTFKNKIECWNIIQGEENKWSRLVRVILRDSIRPIIEAITIINISVKSSDVFILCCYSMESDIYIKTKSNLIVTLNPRLHAFNATFAGTPKIDANRYTCHTPFFSLPFSLSHITPLKITKHYKQVSLIEIIIYKICYIFILENKIVWLRSRIQLFFTVGGWFAILEFSLTKETLCKILLKLHQWLHRRSWKMWKY